MANTEGFSDEALESMVTEQHRSLADQRNTTTTTKSSSTAASRKSALHQRMETPMGSKPAASVVRKAPNDVVTTKNPKSKKNPTAIKIPQVMDEDDEPQPQETAVENDNNNAEVPQPKQPQPPVVLGGIVERPRRRSRKQRKKANSNATAAATSRNDAATTRMHHPNGFPSLTAPVGTYVASSRSTKNDNKGADQPLDELSSAHPPSSSSWSQLRKDTSKEADAMLSQMARAEIDESKRELEQTLSPELVAFLRQRRRQPQPQSNQQQQQPPETTASAQDETKAETPSTTDSETQQQHALYDKLASIQTYGDLDAAYQEEHDGETGPFHVEFEQGSISDRPFPNQHEEFQVACDLLRSSVPRQTLWAAQTIQKALASDFAAGKRVRGSNSNNNATQPYPVTLPVSLRCLLDVPASQRSNNGYLLHGYVLQSLYLLLRMIVVPDHDVDVTLNVDKEGADTVVTTNHAIYQQWYANDTVPCTPIDQCYQAGSAMKPVTVDGQENAAYASTSSSESAEQHSRSFWKDPMWTLLSQMKLIPRLAQLVTTHHEAAGESLGSSSTMTRLPKEAISAVCGILAIMSQRSPGAASAIAQHETLVSHLLTLALEEGEEENENESTTNSATFDVPVVFPVVLLFSVLARQSNVAAKMLEEPHAEELLTRILSITVPHHEKSQAQTTIAIQRWTLILWRTLLRYGHGTQFLETVLTVTASQRVLGWHCQAELFSCLAILLRKNTVENDNDNNRSSLCYALRSVVKDVACLEEATRQSSLRQRDVLTLATCLEFLKACKEQDLATDSSEASETFFNVEAGNQVQKLLSILVDDSGGWFRKCVSISLSGFFHNPTIKGGMVFEEATSCRFLDAFLSLVQPSWSLGRWVSEDNLASILKCLGEEIEREAKGTPEKKRKDGGSPYVCRDSWRNHCHARVFELMLSSGRVETDSMLLDSRIHTSMAVTLIGRFQAGEEALAQRVLGVCSTFPKEFDASPSLVMLASMLLGNLKSSSQNKAQLGHSLRLSGEKPLFTDQNQNWEDDLPTLNEVLGGPALKTSELLLPVGGFWLWKIFAGSSSSDYEASSDVLEVLLAACRTINSLEASARNGTCTYCDIVDVGGKLYYLLNLCLQEESLLAVDEVMCMADKLLVDYTTRLDRVAVETFLAECSLHSATGSAKDGNKDEEKLTEDEEKVKAWLTATDSNSKTMKDLMNFMGDLCKAYTDYGAQYGIFFTRALRSFLLPAFPSKVRCEVLRRLDGLLHLFTIEESKADLQTALETYVRGDKNEANVDPEWLDTLANLFARGSGRSQRPDFIFLRALAVHTLGLSMIRSLETTRYRLQGTEDEFTLACLNMAAHMVKKPKETFAESIAHAVTLPASPREQDRATWAEIAELIQQQGDNN